MTYVTPISTMKYDTVTGASWIQVFDKKTYVYTSWNGTGNITQPDSRSWKFTCNFK